MYVVGENYHILVRTFRFTLMVKPKFLKLMKHAILPNLPLPHNTPTKTHNKFADPPSSSILSERYPQVPQDDRMES